jgi:drug/metabolite transporter (DMT)-like permease
MDRKFVLTAFGYAVIGLALGIFMAASKNHGQLVTHAHVMLVGFLLSFIYALCHKLWLPAVSSGLATAQYYIHQTGSALLFVGLFLLYGNFAKEESIEPVLSIGSVTVFIGVVLMKIHLIRTNKSMSRAV